MPAFRPGVMFVLPLFLVMAAAGQTPPAAEHHAHLQSPRAAHLLSTTNTRKHEAEEANTASDLIAALDAAHIRLSVALSDSYRFGAPWQKIPNEAAEVDRENEWTAAEAAKYPDRLMAFCSVNALKPYAKAAIEHCHALGMRGLKLHLANAGFYYDHPQDVAALAQAFREANDFHMAILIHLRPREGWAAVKDIQIFFKEVLPKAPDVMVQIAHLAGWGGYDRSTDAGLSALLDLCEKQKSACSHLYFDLAAVLLPKDAEKAADEDTRLLAKEQAGFTEGPARLAANLRCIPKGHVLFATDWPDIKITDNVQMVRSQLLLKPDEIDEILDSKAPYFDRMPKSSGR
ncbi:MAG TPA: amidohydrolase family protein [Acidobacteriaceae bacterium]|nr:amidohydrolase family protein [Acidobacteriaceae bacterium]